MPTPIVYILGAALLTFYVLKKTYLRTDSHPLPPGPKPFPIVGNVTDLPGRNTKEWRHWLKFKDLYGDLSSVTVMGQTIILVHDKTAIVDLMEKKATYFSDRPWMEFGMRMYGNFLALPHCAVMLMATGAVMRT
jgi:hypothetical protein